MNARSKDTALERFGIRRTGSVSGGTDGYRGQPGQRNPNRLFYERYDGEPLSQEYRQRYLGIAK